MQERVVMHFKASMLSLLEAPAYMYTHSAIKDGWPDSWTEVGTQSYAKIWFSVCSALLLSEESWFANPEHCSSFFLSFVMVSIRTATTYAIWSDQVRRHFKRLQRKGCDFILRYRGRVLCCIHTSKKSCVKLQVSVAHLWDPESTSANRNTTEIKILRKGGKVHAQIRILAAPEF